MGIIGEILGKIAAYLGLGFVGFLVGATVTCIIILNHRKKKANTADNKEDTSC